MPTAVVLSKAEQAYEKLHQLIRQGHFNGEIRVTEAKLAEQLGMSRGPVRESLLRLQTEGFLKAVGNRRSRRIVHIEDQNPEDVLQRYELREQIEGAAARLAAKNMNGWQIDRLREIVSEVEACESRGDGEGRYDAALAFHQFLVENCGNRLLLSVWEQHRLWPSRPRTALFEQQLRSQLPRADRPSDWLSAVTDAIAAHDPELAEQTVRDRVRLTTEVIRKSIWNSERSEEKQSK